jgi:hypothetical protein
MLADVSSASMETTDPTNDELLLAMDEACKTNILSLHPSLSFSHNRLDEKRVHLINFH